MRLEINTYRFDLEVAKRQLARVKEEKLCQVERIFVVQKIAKLEEDLQVDNQKLSRSYLCLISTSGNSQVEDGEQETVVREQGFVKSRVKTFSRMRRNLFKEDE